MIKVTFKDEFQLRETGTSEELPSAENLGRVSEYARMDAYRYWLGRIVNGLG